jgi:hypothetical protein
MKKTVRFDTTNITTHEIPALDGKSIRSGEPFYSRRDIESFIAVHYMEEMSGLLTLATDESTQGSRFCVDAHVIWCYREARYDTKFVTDAFVNDSRDALD